MRNMSWPIRSFCIIHRSVCNISCESKLGTCSSTSDGTRSRRADAERRGSGTLTSPKRTLRSVSGPWRGGADTRCSYSTRAAEVLLLLLVVLLAVDAARFGRMRPLIVEEHV